MCKNRMRLILISFFFLVSVALISADGIKSPSCPLPSTPTKDKPKEKPKSSLKKCSSTFEVDLNRIYGGQDANPMEFPHQVSLQVRFLDSHICGGTLIDQQWVLTAAHCFSRGRYPFSWQVKVGEHNLKEKDETERTLRVKRVIVHEQYNRTNQVNDIALIQLLEPIDLEKEKHLKTVCLADKSVVVREEYYCMASGWGRGNKGRIVTEVLQKLKQPIHNSTECAKIWEKSVWPVTENHICIGDLQGSKGICNGDSGGPIQCRLRTGEWVQFGIASWTIRDCISKGYAAVFTGVSGYLDWIDKQMETYG
ncbi:hypothetical protein NH340_JMT07436 [Sarcoptes scabiei]|nr:hypothetical protein NH340_JMT07436 [Sarcoptes scabiei]